MLASAWFDHVSGWYNHAKDFNILFLTYEEMKKVRSIVSLYSRYFLPILNAFSDRSLDLSVIMEYAQSSWRMNKLRLL